MLRLFVWNNSFCLYTSGIAFALAETEAEARQLILDAAVAPHLDHAAELKGKKRDKWLAWALALAEKNLAEGELHVYETPHGEFLQGGE